jgi:EAL domain-containing protein (putative c-di-GMP-specific phosphodiesterase class I)/FixJ family two-component response regulator
MNDTGARILLIDDEHLILKALARILGSAGHRVVTANDGETALKLIEAEEYDVVFTDLHMPGINGMELIRTIRETQRDVPVVILTGNPHVESAMEAVEFGALRYLSKPVDAQTLNTVVDTALQKQRTQRFQRRAVQLLGDDARYLGDADPEGAFQHAVDAIWMGYQPIVSLETCTTYAYEALVRSRDPAFPNPGILFSAAERLNRLELIGRTIRGHVARDFQRSPIPCLFVNLHSRDLLDETLIDPDAPLSKLASSIVLEITERADLDHIRGLRPKIKEVRKLGYRIAVDDLGAGYAGLNSLAMLEPEVVKLDMTLVRDVHRESTKKKLVKVMNQFCADIGALVVAEGVETRSEMETLRELGCKLFQGYYFAKPGADFPVPRMPDLHPSR